LGYGRHRPVPIGILIGAASGYYGGYVDSLLMRFTEAVMTIPSSFCC
jgi:peptide/nickel transport system permease protein